MMVVYDERHGGRGLTWMQAVLQQLAAEGVTTGSLDGSRHVGTEVKRARAWNFVQAWE